MPVSLEEAPGERFARGAADPNSHSHFGESDVMIPIQTGPNGEPKEEQAPLAPPAEEVSPPDAAELARQLEESRARELRLLADMQNLRRRAERDFEREAERRKRDLLLDLLDALDDLDRMIAHEREEAAQAAGPAAQALFDGARAAREKFLAALERHGARRFDPQGQPFDPHRHEAVAMIATAGAAPGTVAETALPGWTLGEELLRPARVAVAQADPAAGRA